MEFQRENPNCVVRRRDVAPLLEKALKKIPQSAIINGFRACGLYPCNVENVDFSKCLEIEIEDDDVAEEDDEEEFQNIDFNSSLIAIEHVLGKEKVQACLQKKEGCELL